MPNRNCPACQMWRPDAGGVCADCAADPETARAAIARRVAVAQAGWRSAEQHRNAVVSALGGQDAERWATLGEWQRQAAEGDEAAAERIRRFGGYARQGRYSEALRSAWAADEGMWWAQQAYEAAREDARRALAALERAVAQAA